VQFKKSPQLMRGPLDRSMEDRTMWRYVSGDLELRQARVALSVRLRNTLRGLGLLADPGAWIDPAGRVLICSYPSGRRALARLQGLGIRRLVNLHERGHAPNCLGAYALTESHVPMADFAPPTRAQLATALGVIHAVVSAGERVAVHCGGGLGRSGTVAACYLVELGLDWRAAVARVRAVRPGAIETPAQLASIIAHAERRTALARGAV
jgi:atypical dual specificity phosphatase